jgi:hypothetical protein
LLLVEALSDRWGHHPAAGPQGSAGKTVWALLTISPPVAANGLPLRILPPPARPHQQAVADQALLGRVLAGLQHA